MCLRRVPVSEVMITITRVISITIILIPSLVHLSALEESMRVTSVQAFQPAPLVDTIQDTILEVHG